MDARLFSSHSYLTSEETLLQIGAGDNWGGRGSLSFAIDVFSLGFKCLHFSSDRGHGLLGGVGLFVRPFGQASNSLEIVFPGAQSGPQVGDALLPGERGLKRVLSADVEAFPV